MMCSFSFTDSFLSIVSPSAKSRLSLRLTLLASCMASTPLHAVDEFLGLGFVPGNYASEANDVSADGSVAVGWSESGSYKGVYGDAFRWTASDGMVGLGFLPGDSLSKGNGVNENGSVVVGWSGNEHFDLYAWELVRTPQAFRWTASDGMVGLGFLPGDTLSLANGVNADGSVVVGWSGNSYFDLSLLQTIETHQAFRWTATGGMVGLGFLPGDDDSQAYGVNADGSVLVGSSSDGSFWDEEAFRWTATDGMVGLGFLPGDDVSRAYSVNADGSVVVGSSGSEAFRWTAIGGMVGLGFLPGDAASQAYGVNADGSVVVGSSGSEAFRWTESGGMQPVADWLAEAGVSLVGWKLETANAVNADGSVAVGSGTNPDGAPEAWLARNESGLIGLNTFGSSLGSVVGTASLGIQLAGLALGGSHHQPLLAQNFLDGDNCAWINGDLGYYNRDRDADLALGEMGACHDFIPGQLRAGLGIGASRATEDLDFSGDTELDGQYLLAELDYQIPDSTIIASFTALAGEWDATIDRGYLNAGSPDQSRGKTDVDVTAVRIRLDWFDAYSNGDVTFSPRVEYNHFRTRADGYTEKGGGFPAHYDSRSDTVRELRIGGNAEMGLSETAYLRGMLEGVHRFDDEGPRLSGNVIGLFGFSLPGEDFRQNWARAGVEIGKRVSTNSVVSASVNASTKGEDPDYSAGVSLKTIF